MTNPHLLGITSNHSANHKLITALGAAGSFADVDTIFERLAGLTIGDKRRTIGDKHLTIGDKLDLEKKIKNLTKRSAQIELLAEDQVDHVSPVLPALLRLPCRPPPCTCSV